MLDAAFDAFADQGYDAMSVRELARALGVSHNTIPQRFGSKERLWRAAVDHVLEGMVAEMLSLDLGEQADGLTRLRTLMIAFVELHARRPQALRLITTESARPGPRLDHLFRHFIEPSVALAKALLADLHSRRLVRTDDVVPVYFAMVHAAASPVVHPSLLAKLGGGVDLADPDAVRRWATHSVDLLLDGLVAG